MVDGIRLDFELGQLVTKVDGRNLSLNQNSATNPTKRYLQITGISYDRNNQRTSLEVQSFDDVRNSYRSGRSGAF